MTGICQLSYLFGSGTSVRIAFRKEGGEIKWGIRRESREGLTHLGIQNSERKKRNSGINCSNLDCKLGRGGTEGGQGRQLKIPAQRRQKTERQNPVAGDGNVDRERGCGPGGNRH